MKKLLISIFVGILIVSMYFSIIWAIIEFILYLVKDKEFNWLSVYSAGTLFTVVVLVLIIPLPRKTVERTTKTFKEKLDEVSKKNNL